MNNENNVYKHTIMSAGTDQSGGYFSAALMEGLPRILKSNKPIYLPYFTDLLDANWVQ